MNPRAVTSGSQLSRRIRSARIVVARALWDRRFQHGKALHRNVWHREFLARQHLGNFSHFEVRGDATLEANQADEPGARSRSCRSSRGTEIDDRADDLALLHVSEAVVDLLEFDPVGDQVVEVEPPLHVELY